MELKAIVKARGSYYNKEVTILQFVPDHLGWTKAVCKANNNLITFEISALELLDDNKSISSKELGI